jgi:hypothetical protein
LIVGGLYDWICKKHLFCRGLTWKGAINNVSTLLAHLDKKPKLADVCCEGVMQNFIHGLYPGRIDIALKTGNERTVDRLWHVERSPCRGCDDFYHRHHSVKTHDQVHKEMDAHMEVLGWFSGSIRTMLQNNQRTTIPKPIRESHVLVYGRRMREDSRNRDKPEPLFLPRLR